MSNEIIQVNADKISVMTGYKAEEVAIVKATVAKGTTDTELAYFLNVCKTVGLNPFNKEIWCYKDHRGNVLVFTGRDGFLSKAQSNPAFNGIRSCEVCENDEFSIDIANNQIKHTFGKGERGKILGAYAIAFRKDGEPTIEYADIKDYDKKKFTWETHKSAMIKKVAETNALKKGFGISGVQSEYDYEVKGNIATPFTTEKSTLDIKTKELIDLIDSLPEDEQETFKGILRDKRNANEVTLDLVEDMIKQIKQPV